LQPWFEPDFLISAKSGLCRNALRRTGLKSQFVALKFQHLVGPTLCLLLVLIVDTEKNGLAIKSKLAQPVFDCDEKLVGGEGLMASMQD